MKNILTIIISFYCSYNFINCSEISPTENSNTKYNGTWLWFQTVGGIFPRVMKPENGTMLKISYDRQGKFKIYRNDSLKVIAGYYIGQVEHNQEKISYYDVVTVNNFYFDAEPDYPALLTDTLVLWDGAYDGFFSFYKKLY
jgi:hypothetical protein